MFSIKHKVWLIAGLAALMTTVIIAVGMMGVTRANDALGALRSGVLTDLDQSNQSIQDLLELQNDILSYAMWRLMNADKQKLDELERNLMEDLARVDQSFRSTVDPEKLDTYLTHVRNAFALVKRNPRLGFMSLTGASSMFDDVMSEHGQDLMISKSMVVKEIDRTLEQGLLVIWTFFIVAASIGSTMALAAGIISRSIVATIRSLTNTMGALAADDLDVTITDVDRRDELGQMARAVAVFKANAIEKRQIENDLADYREHLEELVEARTEELERQREQIEEALLKERELSGLQRQFVSMVSHEFRTPLAIIDGNAQRLLRRLGNLAVDRQESILLNVRRAVSRLTELMESVLSAARLENGQISLQPAPCSLAQMIDDVAASYRDLHPEREFVVDKGSLPEEIVADLKLLRQVLSNLISNAVKYSPDRTHVWIGGATDRKGRAVITVRDDGLGIPAEEHEKVFQRFFRARTSTGIAGSGIGLHLSAHLVAIHGGELTFESAEGEGTTFSMHLPLVAQGSQYPSGPDEVDDAVLKPSLVVNS